MLPKAGVFNPAYEGPVSCSVQLKTQLNLPEPANRGLIRHTRNLLEKPDFNEI